ncbi:hypothetical protein [Massilia atriviolacea]|nr:hypothetical protein [Massilia atriviolacea]
MDNPQASMRAHGRAMPGRTAMFVGSHRDRDPRVGIPGKMTR